MDNKQMNKGLLPLLTYIIGMFDPYGVSHSTRVKNLTVRLAVRCGVDEGSENLREIGLAADLHDIGKLGIPEYIRRQPGLFLMAERMVMEQHAVIGDKILTLVANGYVTKNVCLYVKHHHEDWGGGGYPDGLKGTNIPLGSRLIRICDFYDAISNARGYRTPLKGMDALAYLVDEQITRTWADPKLFERFIGMIREQEL